VPDLQRVRALLVSDDMINNPGWCIDDVQVWDGDVVPPVFEKVDAPEDTQDLDGPYELSATIEDDDFVADVRVRWNDGLKDHEAPMTGGQADSWTFDFPIVDPGTTIEWSILARDATNNETEYPGAGKVERFPRVPGGAHEPLHVRRPTRGHLGAAQLGGAREPARGRRLPALPRRDGALPRHRGHVDRRRDAVLRERVRGVRDLRDDRRGDRGRQLVAVGGVHLAPDDRHAGPGQRMAGGRAAHRADGHLPPVGRRGRDPRSREGIVVGPGTVTDVDRATFEVSIAGDAAAGPRIATLHSGDLEVAIAAAFEILDGVPPSLTSVEPDSLRQGSHGTVVVTLDHLPADTPVVDLGEGVVVESTTVDGQAVSVEVTVLADAPLGERPVVVDDGERILEGLEFTVRDQVVEADKNCATAPGTGIASVLAALALALARRSRNQL
jgi:hypothetical protein